MKKLVCVIMALALAACLPALACEGDGVSQSIVSGFSLFNLNINIGGGNTGGSSYGGGGSCGGHREVDTTCWDDDGNDEDGYVYDFDEGWPETQGRVGYIVVPSCNINIYSARVRAAARYDAQVIACVEEGETVEVLGMEGGFYKCRKNGRVGYIAVELVSFDRPVIEYLSYDAGTLLYAWGASGGRIALHAANGDKVATVEAGYEFEPIAKAHGKVWFCWQDAAVWIDASLVHADKYTAAGGCRGKHECGLW